jgi:hypothetical protein
VAEPELAGDDGERLVGEEVEVAREHPQVHLIDAEIGEDGQVPDGQHLIEVLVFGQLDPEMVEHLPGKRPVHRRGEVGEEHRHLPADGPQHHEEIVADRRQPERPADAGLLAQRLDQPGEILGERRRQDVRLPGVVLLAVDDDGDVIAAGVRHRRSIGGVAR